MTIEFEVIGELTAQEPLITDLLNDLISSIKNYTEVFMILVFTTLGVGGVVFKTANGTTVIVVGVVEGVIS